MRKGSLYKLCAAIKTLMFLQQAISALENKLRVNLDQLKIRPILAFLIAQAVVAYFPNSTELRGCLVLKKQSLLTKFSSFIIL